MPPSDNLPPSDNSTGDALTTRHRENPLSFSGIVGGLVLLVVVLLACPPLLLFLPFAIIGLVVLALFHAKGQSKARKLASKHLGSQGTSQLQVEFAPGLSSSLVMNDWGVVFDTPGKAPVELSWDEITLVDEPRVATLEFHSHKAPTFEADLSEERYFLAIRSIHSKIPNKIDFQCDPVSGATNLVRRLESRSYEWSGSWGHLVISRDGIEHSKAGRMGWYDIESVVEREYQRDESPTLWELEFNARRNSFVLERRHFDDDRRVGHCGYDMIKAIVEQKIPGKASFTLRPPMPTLRAEHEFDRENEITKVAISLALKSGKWAPLEERFRHMEWLVDTFKLERVCDTRTFFQDYAEMLSRTNRAEEGRRILARADSSNAHR